MAPTLSPLASEVLVELASDAWTTLEDLAGRTGASRRDVESAVQELRAAGKPVIGSSHGVRWSDDPSEIRAYCRQRRHRELEVARGTRELLRAAARLEAEPLTLGIPT